MVIEYKKITIFVSELLFCLLDKLISMNQTPINRVFTP